MQPARHSPSLTLPGLGLLLVVLVFAAYSNCFTAPLVLDDTPNIRNNASLRQLWPPEPARAPGMRGRPVVNFSYALNYAAGGTSVAGYHWVNLGIHAAAGLVLMGIIRRTLRLPAFAGKFAGSAAFLAFAAAVLWSLHPLQTEAVTYLSQRTESLMGLCYLLTLYGFIRGISSAGKTRAWHALAVLTCLLGMGCKEVMVTAPVIVLLYDRTFVAGTFREAWRRRRGFYLALAACWIVLPVLMADFENRGVGFGLGVGSWHYLLTECGAVAKYLGLTLWPAHLVFDYGAAAVPSLSGIWPYALLLAGIVTGVVLALKQRPVIGFLLACPFLILAPSSSVVPLPQQPIAEHRMYLPLAGLVLLAVVGAHRVLGRRALILLPPAILALGATTYRRNAVYRDEVTLWEDTVAKCPSNLRAHQNLGNAYLHTGRLSEAHGEYERALKIDPLNPDALNNIGFLHAQAGRFTEATDYFHQVLRMVPGDAEAHYNLGCVLLSTKREAEAQVEFEQTLRLNPDHASAHNNLATLLAQQGKYREAVQHYSQALRLNPADAETHANRGYANFQQGRLSAAIDDYQQAVNLRPDFEDARKNLERLRQLAGQGPAR